MSLPKLTRRCILLKYAPHAGIFIKAYLDIRCPQAQARVVRQRSMTECWHVSLLAAGGGERHTVYWHGQQAIADACVAALKNAGYAEKRDEETGKIYYS